MTGSLGAEYRFPFKEDILKLLWQVSLWEAFWFNQTLLESLSFNRPSLHWDLSTLLLAYELLPMLVSMGQLNSQFILQFSIRVPHLYPIVLHQSLLLITLMVPLISFIMVMELDLKALDVVDYFFRLSPFLFYIKNKILFSPMARVIKINFSKSLLSSKINHFHIYKLVCFICLIK